MSIPRWPDGPKDEPEDHDKAVNHFQPEKDNPHEDGEKSAHKFSESIRRSLENKLDEETREFEDQEINERHLYQAAAQISNHLEHEFREGEGYLIAEIGPEGVTPIAMGDEEEFFVDSSYDPEVIEGAISPLEVMDRTGYNEEIGVSVMNYTLSDLSGQDIGLWDEWPISTEDMASNNYRIVVAPGLGDGYQEMAKEVTENDELID